MKKILLLLILLSWPLVSWAKTLDNQVVFIPQAPLKEWDDDRFQDGCEEASVLMAVKWARGEKTKTDLDVFREEIVKLASWQEEQYGYYQDTSAQDTADRLLGSYFNFPHYVVKKIESSQEIVKMLEKDCLVIIPSNGQLLKNPYFTAPGPEKHMLVVKGYDYKKKEFIVNDPGTKRGADYRYSEEILFSAIADYLSGQHKSLEDFKREKNVIGVKKVKI